MIHAAHNVDTILQDSAYIAPIFVLHWKNFYKGEFVVNKLSSGKERYSVCKPYFNTRHGYKLDNVYCHHINIKCFYKKI